LICYNYKNNIRILPKKSIKENKFESDMDYKLSEKEIYKAFLKKYNKKTKIRSEVYSCNSPRET